MAPDPTPLALALGRIPTGLYVVSTARAGRPLGFVGSFLMQVGFAPPVVCVAVAKGREHLSAIRAHGRFAVSILGQGNQALMKPFFRKHEEGRSGFDDLSHRPTPGGLPVLDQALAWLECRTTAEHDGGDHAILFGTVEHGELLRSGEPAVHLRKNGLDY